jgi:predicted nucleotidyltransferase
MLMKTIEQLATLNRKALANFRARIGRKFPEWTIRMTLFGSRARDNAEPDSDVGVLVEIETESVSFWRSNAFVGSQERYPWTRALFCLS